MKQLLFCLFLCSITGISQNYVDLAKLSYGHTFDNRFEGTEFSTTVLIMDADISVRIPINEKYVVISGFTFSKNRLRLFPDAPFQNLYSTFLKAGVLTQYNEKWSSTVVLLPQVA